MILNISKIKTEALLLFCKDIIISYNLKEDIHFDVDKNTKDYINHVTSDILKQLQRGTHSNEFYLDKQSNSRTKAVLATYNFINKSLSNELEDGKTFNPSMLYLSLMATWFSELSKESKSKEFIYFSMYPYADVYDKLLINIKDIRFKTLNICMIDLAEKIIYKLDKYKFNQT